VLLRRKIRSVLAPNGSSSIAPATIVVGSGTASVAATLSNWAPVLFMVRTSDIDQGDVLRPLAVPYTVTALRVLSVAVLDEKPFTVPDAVAVPPMLLAVVFTLNVLVSGVTGPNPVSAKVIVKVPAPVDPAVAFTDNIGWVVLPITGLESPVSTLMFHTPIVPTQRIWPVIGLESPAPPSVITNVSAGMPSERVIVIEPYAGNRLTAIKPATVVASFIISLVFIFYPFFLIFSGFFFYSFFNCYN